MIGPGARLHPGVTSWSHGENAVLPRGGLARRARGVFGFWRAKLGPLCEPVKNLKNYFEVIFIARLGPPLFAVLAPWTRADGLVISFIFADRSNKLR